MINQGCETLTEAIYALKFPSYEDMIEVPWRHINSPGISNITASEWVVNFSDRGYKCMKAIFESKGDPQVIEAQGSILSLLPIMQSAFYIYNLWIQEAAHALGATLKQICIIRYSLMNAIEIGWDGVGEWRF